MKESLDVVKIAVFNYIQEHKLNENFDTFDRDTLKRKFFELNNNSGS
jgi:hypothetical protein